MAGVELQKFANVIQCDMKCKINNNNKKQQKTASCFAASTVRTARLAEFKLLGHVILTAVLETHIKHFATKKFLGGCCAVVMFVMLVYIFTFCPEVGANRFW